MYPISILSSPVILGTPLRAFGDEAALDPAEVQDFGSKDVNRIQGNIAKALARATPFLDILPGGTLPSGVSDTVRAIVQERAVLNQSLVRPRFTEDTQIGGKTGTAAETGTTEYTYSLQTNRGMGPLVCIKGMRNAFETSYSSAEDALKKQVIQLSNSDVRINLVDQSGCKLTVVGGASFTEMFDGGMQAINTPFTATVGVPTAPINFKLLEYLGTFLRENFLVEGFEGNGSEPILKFIGSQEIISGLRDNLDVKTNYQYLAAGSYKIGETALTRYRWEGPYRGWAFGVDPQPLRFSKLADGTTDMFQDTTIPIPAGQPVFIEPEIKVEVAHGTFASRPNPLWVRARYEVALACGANSFRRLAPAQYTGEASFKFPAQLTMGELKWKVIEDNLNNVWGDFGRHFYQISRAYRPERPHNITAIAFKRNAIDFGLAESTPDSSDWSSSAAL